MRILLSLIALFVALAANAQRMGRQDYVAKYKNWAIAEMNRTGIPASITLAQGILESDCGNSDLAVDANNHFGIKCHSDWTGKTMHKDDDKNNECFRSYDSAYDSFKDHSDFLTSKTRYAELFKLDKTDYKAWAKGLKKCGYATERTYAERLIAIIEEEGLAAYDSDDYVDTTSDDDTSSDSSTSSDEMQNLTDDANNTSGSDSQKSTPTKKQTQKKKSSNSGKSSSGSSTSKRTTPKVKAVFDIDPLPTHEVKYNNGVQYVEIGSSDTFQSIATEFHMMLWELYKYNDLAQGADISKLQYLYLRPKRNRAHPDCQSHEVKQGETLWDIAHAYGVKLSKLEKRNGLAEGANPAVGTTISLR